MDIHPDERIAPEFKEQASAHANRFQERAKDYLQSGKSSAAHEADRVADAISEAANRLKEQNDFFAPFLNSAADRVHAASRYLQEHDTNTIVDTVRDFSKKNPYLTVGGMFAAGFALSRFLHAGNSDMEQGGQK
jgi:ElaB/YqjD/DUF883 family membrane-anchored ribosome-binding protein